MWFLIFHTDTCVSQDSRLVTWDAVCSQVLGRELHVWSVFASAVFVRRVKVMMDSELQCFSDRLCLNFIMLIQWVIFFVETWVLNYTVVLDWTLNLKAN